MAAPLSIIAIATRGPGRHHGEAEMGEGTRRAQRVGSFRHVRHSNCRKRSAALSESLEQRLVFCEAPHGHDAMFAAEHHAAASPVASAAVATASVAPAAVAAAAAGTFTESVVFSGLTQPTVVR